jgi:hypothetical protein
MPYLTAHNPEGKIVTKNFVYRNFEQELGRTGGRRRIKDTVEYSEDQGKWIVKKLAAGKWSDIRNHKAEWNAFNRGQNYLESGVPLSILFPHDPAKVSMFKRHSIVTIERCAALTEEDCDIVGMGARDARAKARRYLERAKENAGGIAANARIDSMERENVTLKAEIANLTAKLTEVLQAQLDAAEVAPKLPRKQKSQPQAEA